MEIKWIIRNLISLVNNGLVIKVKYACIAKQDNKEESILGTIILEGSPSEPGFIPFEGLTEKIVINWVKDELGTEKVTEIQLQAQDKLVNPPKPLPEKSYDIPW